MKLKSAFFVFAALGTSFAFSSFTGSGNAQQDADGKIVFVTDTADGRKIVINSQYSLVIPNHMKESKSLNDDASLQYADEEEELYIIVIDEPTDEFVKGFKNEKGWDPTMTAAENYRRVQIGSLKNSMKVKGKPVIQKTKASTYSMEVVDFTGKVKGIEDPIGYKVGFLECNGNLYMMMTWTLQSMKTLHNNEMNEMLKSFRDEK
jgi:hypothetical protein